MEQYKLKLKILQLSKIISISNFENSFKNLTKLTRKGKFIGNSIIKGKLSLKCSFKFCKEKEIKIGENIKIFFQCKHIYHKKCIEDYYIKAKEFYESNENDNNNNIIDIEKIEDFDNLIEKNIFVNKYKENKQDISSCIICTGFDLL
jgi:hypothetical protein